MAITTMSGPVSHLHQSTQVAGAMNQGTGFVNSAQVMNFRIGNRPVSFKFTEGGVSDGDIVTVAGYQKSGTFRALSLRNETTGAEQSVSSTRIFIIAGCSLVLGVPLSFVVIGIPFLLLGLYFAYVGVRNARAKGLLAATPQAPAVASA